MCYNVLVMMSRYENIISSCEWSCTWLVKECAMHSYNFIIKHLDKTRKLKLSLVSLLCCFFHPQSEQNMYMGWSHVISNGRLWVVIPSAAQWESGEGNIRKPPLRATQCRAQIPLWGRTSSAPYLNVMFTETRRKEKVDENKTACLLVVSFTRESVDKLY